MAVKAYPKVRQLARAAFARSLEWENQPAGRRLVARPAGTSRRTIVAACGARIAVVSRSSLAGRYSVDSTPRANRAEGAGRLSVKPSRDAARIPPPKSERRFVTRFARSFSSAEWKCGGREGITLNTSESRDSVSQGCEGEFKGDDSMESRRRDAGPAKLGRSRGSARSDAAVSRWWGRAKIKVCYARVWPVRSALPSRSPASTSRCRLWCGRWSRGTCAAATCQQVRSRTGRWAPNSRRWRTALLPAPSGSWLLSWPLPRTSSRASPPNWFRSPRGAATCATRSTESRNGSAASILRRYQSVSIWIC